VSRLRTEPAPRLAWPAPRLRVGRHGLAGVPLEAGERVVHVLVIAATAGHPFLLLMRQIIGASEVQAMWSRSLFRSRSCRYGPVSTSASL
jgi:hypothetical protein